MWATVAIVLVTKRKLDVTNACPNALASPAITVTVLLRSSMFRSPQPGRLRILPESGGA